MSRPFDGDFLLSRTKENATHAASLQTTVIDCLNAALSYSLVGTRSRRPRAFLTVRNRFTPRVRIDVRPAPQVRDDPFQFVDAVITDHDTPAGGAVLDTYRRPQPISQFGFQPPHVRILGGGFPPALRQRRW